MKLSKALRITKKYLARNHLGALDYDNKSQYICIAAEIAKDEGELEDDRQIKTFIESHLNRYSSVWQWLAQEGHLPDAANMSNQEYIFWRDQVQKYRHRWIAHLIKELEKKGQ